MPVMHISFGSEAQNTDHIIAAHLMLEADLCVCFRTEKHNTPLLKLQQMFKRVYEAVTNAVL